MTKPEEEQQHLNVPFPPMVGIQPNCCSEGQDGEKDGGHYRGQLPHQNTSAGLAQLCTGGSKMMWGSPSVDVYIVC